MIKSQKAFLEFLAGQRILLTFRRQVCIFVANLEKNIGIDLENVLKTMFLCLLEAGNFSSREGSN